jgi:hypothetical protein
MKLIKSCRICFAMAVAFLLLSGCANQPRNMYTWGAYQNQVYAHFKNTGSPEQQIAALEKAMAKSTTKSFPPGYHAHLGLLYGEVGRMDDMQVEFEAEKLLFPESAPFMDFMLNKINTNNNKKGAL